MYSNVADKSLHIRYSRIKHFDLWTNVTTGVPGLLRFRVLHSPGSTSNRYTILGPRIEVILASFLQEVESRMPAQV